jgi:wyosine [tRNA(Phe)-imidazoG37] synthetase (radical SAM superfamily)
MTSRPYQYLFGPVPSRRLGRSLGVDIVPFKTCSYDCVYCQLGRTTNKTLERKEYVAVEEVLAELERKLADQPIPDYISLAGSGEPTLNSGIGDLIGKIKSMTDIPVAVLTNGSLLWMSEVQDALMMADLVLPSLDAGDDRLFQYVNRPHENLPFERMVEGLTVFTQRFWGEVWLEVLLLGGVTEIPDEVEKIASIVRRIRPVCVQLNTVSRPPAEAFAFPLTRDRMNALKDVFPGKVDIISESGRSGTGVSTFVQATDTEIVALLSRRPCTSEDVAGGLGLHITESLKHLESLIAIGKVNTVVIGGRHFYTVKQRTGEHK